MSYREYQGNINKNILGIELLTIKKLENSKEECRQHIVNSHKNKQILKTHSQQFVYETT